jgi:uridine kinase
MSKTNNKPFVNGVAGGSGSGKSTVTSQVMASIGSEMTAVVFQDDYYCDQTHLSSKERRKTNYDHLDAFDWPLMVQHVQALRRGESIEMSTCDFTRDNPASQTITVKPAPVIVIEGLLALFDADLRHMMSLKVFVHRVRCALYSSLATRYGRARTQRRECDRAVSGNRAPQAQAVHRAHQAPRRCDSAPRSQWACGGHHQHQGVDPDL